MLRKLVLVVALAGIAGAAGCYTSEGYGPYEGYSVSYISPGVGVVTNSDYPVFYYDNSYWLYNNGYWYTSPYYNGGWVYATPPPVLLSIGNPYAYRHYRGYGHYYYGHNYYYGRHYYHPYYHPYYHSYYNYRARPYYGGRYYGHPGYNPHYQARGYTYPRGGVYVRPHEYHR